MPYSFEFDQMWLLVKENLKTRYPTTVFELWFNDILPISFSRSSKEGVFATLSEFKCDVLQSKYKPIVEETFLSVCGVEVSIQFIYDPQYIKDGKLEMLLFTTENLQQKIDADVQRREIYNKAPVEDGVEIAQRSRYTFDNFIVGASNKFAHAACYKVSQAPALQWNPLFIYGPSGVGKTHLMYAVINEIHHNIPFIRVFYTKGDDFVNYMIECLSKQQMSTFRDRYRSCDVLLVDDIQFIAGKIATQEEFFNTFQTLLDEGKQIILASDRPPRDINPLSERLRSRFEQGLLADIGLPDLELRIAIIKKKAEDMGISLSEEVLAYLAENLRSNIRQIEGAIKKIEAKSLLDGRQITLELAKACVSDLLGDEEPISVTIDKVFAAVFRKFDISREEIVGKKRTKEIMRARHIAVYLMREITEMSLLNIGKLFERDHATIMASINVVKKKMNTDPLYLADIESLKKDILGE